MRYSTDSPGFAEVWPIPAGEGYARHTPGLGCGEAPALESGGLGPCVLRGDRTNSAREGTHAHLRGSPCTHRLKGHL